VSVNSFDVWDAIIISTGQNPQTSQNIYKILYRIKVKQFSENCIIFFRGNENKV